MTPLKLPKAAPPKVDKKKQEQEAQLKEDGWTLNTDGYRPYFLWHDPLNGDLRHESDAIKISNYRRTIPHSELKRQTDLHDRVRELEKELDSLLKVLDIRRVGFVATPAKSILVLPDKSKRWWRW